MNIVETFTIDGIERTISIIVTAEEFRDSFDLVKEFFMGVSVTAVTPIDANDVVPDDDSRFAEIPVVAAPLVS